MALRPNCASNPRHVISIMDSQSYVPPRSIETLGIRLAFCILSIHSSVSRRGDLEGGVEHAASIFDHRVRVFGLSLIQCPPCPALLAFRLVPLSQHPSTAVCRLHLGSLIVGHPLLPP